MAFDLENFPTRETAKYMLSMVSPIYEKSYVMKWYFEVLGYYLDIANKTIKEELANEAFPETATWSLPYWEQAYGIETNESLSIEQRRAKILQKRNFRRAMNPARIAAFASSFTGRECTVVENTAPHTYEIHIYPGDSEVNVDALRKELNKMKQSQKHIVILFIDSSDTHLKLGAAATGTEVIVTSQTY